MVFRFLVANGCPQQKQREQRAVSAVLQQINVFLWATLVVTFLVKVSDVFKCPSGLVGKAFRGKYGSYVDSARFVCDYWNK